MTEQFDTQKTRAAAWFRQLRDDIVSAFEALEDSHAEGPMSDGPAGRFEVTETKRTSDDGSDAGGHQAFWFAWSQFRPDTLLWPSDF